MSKVRNSETVFTAAAAAQLTREHRECVCVCALHVIADNSPQTTPTHTWASNAHTQWLERLLQSILCTQTYTHTHGACTLKRSHTHTQTEENVCAYGLRGVVVDAVAVVAQLFARVHRRCFFPLCAFARARARIWSESRLAARRRPVGFKHMWSTACVSVNRTCTMQDARTCVRRRIAMWLTKTTCLLAIFDSITQSHKTHKTPPTFVEVKCNCWLEPFNFDFSACSNVYAKMISSSEQFSVLPI